MSLNLHLGCGKRSIPGFLHIDVAPFPHIDFRQSIDNLSAFADGTVDLIYCSHAFTYFDRVQGLEALIEWRRALKPGGVLRLAVSDFAALVQVYRAGGSLDTIIGPLFGRMAIDGLTGPTILYHKTTYDFASLSAVCEKAGFHSVRQYDWRDTIHKDYDDCSQAYVPHMDKDNGRLISLNIEARK
jgi:predicted SAM-dependent methyltransferase